MYWTEYIPVLRHLCFCLGQHGFLLLQVWPSCYNHLFGTGLCIYGRRRFWFNNLHHWSASRFGILRVLGVIGRFDQHLFDKRVRTTSDDSVICDWNKSLCACVKVGLRSCSARISCEFLLFKKFHALNKLSVLDLRGEGKMAYNLRNFFFFVNVVNIKL